MRYSFTKLFLCIATAAVALVCAVSSPVLADGSDLPADQQEHLDSLPDDTTRNEYLRDLVAKNDGDFRYHFHAGNSYFDVAKMEEAVKHLSRAIELKPDFVKAYVNLGNAYDEMNQLDKALQTYHKALEIEPNEDKTLCNIGGVYFRKRQIDQAMASFLKALEVNPTSQLAHYNLAILFADAGIFGEAIAEWEKAAALDPASDLGQRSNDNIGIIRQMQSAETPELEGDQAHGAEGDHSGHSH